GRPHDNEAHPLPSGESRGQRVDHDSVPVSVDRNERIACEGAPATWSSDRKSSSPPQPHREPTCDGLFKPTCSEPSEILSSALPLQVVDNIDLIQNSFVERSEMTPSCALKQGRRRFAWARASRYFHPRHG